MNFSTNQVMQFYCVAEAPTLKKLGASGKETHAFIEVPNAKGEIVRSDLIQIGHVLDVKYKTAGNDTRALSGYKLELSSSVNGGDPVVGQEYIVRVMIRGTIGEECTYTKQASVVAKTGDTAGSILAKLAGNLLINLTEDSVLYDLYDDTVGSSYKLSATVKDGEIVLKKNGSTVTELTSLIIAEPKPFWKLGTFPEQTMNMVITTSPIVVDSTDEPRWATVTKVSAGSLPNTHIIADMEYFALGEKGADDVHGFSIITDGNVDLLVDKNDATGYNVLTVQYYHTGARDAVQKSERTLVIVGKSTVDLSSLATAFEALK
jgi:hypothetical protein